MFFINHCSAYETQIISELKNDKIADIAENADIKHRDKIIEKAVNDFYASRSAAAENQTAQ